MSLSRSEVCGQTDTHIVLGFMSHNAAVLNYLIEFLTLCGVCGFSLP